MIIEEFRTLIAEASDDTLAAYRQSLDVELTMRRHREEAIEVMDGIAQTYSVDVGREVGDVWVQPTGAHNAYPKAAVVSHADKMWVNLTPANVWEPGVSGWREQAPADAAPPEFVQPTGAHDAYSTGDLVTWEGQAYRSRIDGNVWTPMSHPSGWVQTKPLPPSDGVGTPGASPWVQPTGGHDSYGVGDIVSFEGSTWRSLIDANTWSPTAYPAGWEKI